MEAGLSHPLGPALRHPPPTDHYPAGVAQPQPGADPVNPFHRVALALLAVFVVAMLAGGWLIAPAVGLLCLAGACLVVGLVLGVLM